MTPEERSLLEKTYRLAVENNELLHNLKRRARLATAVKVLYWTVIIGLSFGAFYFIQPYIDFVKNFGGNNSAKTSAAAPKESYAQQLQDLLN